MKYDEFAFFNQQLAAMLRDGIPLEGALRRLCEEMRAGSLRMELMKLGDELAEGKPMAEALKARQLPELYKRMLLVGVKGNDLPGALTMLADYFQRQSNLWIRLKGLMFYPLLVLFMGLFVSVLFTYISMTLDGTSIFSIFDDWYVHSNTYTLIHYFWIFPAFHAFLILVIILAMLVPAIRNRLRWRLPAFKEASIARVAGLLNMLLKGGVSLPEAISFVGQLENNADAAADLKMWRERIADGAGNFSDVAKTNRLFPPMFVWMVANAGENPIAGFQRATEVYQARAIYRTEMAMHAVLPASVLCLGGMVLCEGLLTVGIFMSFMGDTLMV